MLGKKMLMKCGHVADTIVADVQYQNEKVDVAACSFCFNEFGTANQPACFMDHEIVPDEPLPKIKREYGPGLYGALACVLIIIALIVSY